MPCRLPFHIDIIHNYIWRKIMIMYETTNTTCLLLLTFTWVQLYKQLPSENKN